MNKNTIIGLILMTAVIIGYGIYTQPSEEQLAAMRVQDSIDNVIKDEAKKAVAIKLEKEA